MLIEQLAPPVNDPARFALARAPLPDRTISPFRSRAIMSS